MLSSLGDHGTMFDESRGVLAEVQVRWACFHLRPELAGLAGLAKSYDNGFPHLYGEYKHAVICQEDGAT